MTNERHMVGGETLAQKETAHTPKGEGRQQNEQPDSTNPGGGLRCWHGLADLLAVFAGAVGSQLLIALAVLIVGMLS